MKYKLIRKYPTSPELGTIIDNNDVTNFNPKDYPDNWKEIIEYDFEVLTFKSPSGGFLYFENKKCISRSGKINPKITTSYGKLIEYKTEIVSVKRLSDGEVFSIGDNIQYELTNSCFEQGTDEYCDIAYFNIKNGNIYVNSHYIGNSGATINKWIKYKESLFTTEDGVDIYEGDNYWFVDNFNEFKVTNANLDGLSSGISLRFSTKRAAENYIMMNKPFLSIKEVMNCADLAWINDSSLYRELEKLYKDKQ